MNGRFIYLLLLLSFANPVYVSAKKLLPIDEASTDSSFLVLRNRLQQAIEEQDSTYVFSILHPEIRFTFGDGLGIEDFKSFFDFSGKDQRWYFWPKIKLAVSLGGSFYDDSTFVAPYVTSDWPPEIDPYDYTAVIDSNVAVYADTSKNAKILSELDFDIVKLSRDYWMYGDMIKITLEDSTTGFVKSDQLYSPIGYRAWFIKQGGRWLIRYFIAGD